MRWRDLAGHAGTAAGLRRALDGGRLANAYLLEGPAGVGKTRAAAILAQAVLCPKAKKGDACGTCPACKRADAGSHPDLLWIETDPQAREIKADAVRTLIGQVHYKPMEAHRQVAIIPDADRMNENAENALLKTLEEPPGQAVLILTSSRPEALLPTTRSRCARVRFGTIDTATLERLLIEQFDVPAAEAPDLARFGAGSVGRAVEASGETIRAIREFLERSLPGLAHLPDARVAAAAREAEQIVEDHGKALEGERDFTKAAARRVEALRLLSVAGLLLRDAMLVHTAGGRGAWGAAPSAPQPMDWYERALAFLADAEYAVRQNVRVGLVLHVLFIRLSAPA